MDRSKFNTRFIEALDVNWPDRFEWQIKFARSLTELEDRIQNLEDAADPTLPAISAFQLGFIDSLRTVRKTAHESPCCPDCHTSMVKSCVEDEEGNWARHWLCECKVGPPEDMLVPEDHPTGEVDDGRA